MNNENVLSQMGYREFDIAGDLLKAFADQRFASSDDRENFQGIEELGFNSNSGCVYLCDENYNCLMLNDKEQLESWLSCAECGAEGFRSDLNWPLNHMCEECYLKEKEEVEGK